MEHSLFTILSLLVFAVVVAAAVWLAFRMRQNTVTIGDLVFDKKKDLASIDALVNKVGPGEWDAWLKKHFDELTRVLTQEGKFGLADELWLLKSFQDLATKLVEEDEKTGVEEARIQHILKSLKNSEAFDFLLTWMKSSFRAKNSTLDAILKMVEDDRRLLALMQTPPDSASSILSHTPHKPDDVQVRR